MQSRFTRGVFVLFLVGILSRLEGAPHPHRIDPSDAFFTNHAIPHIRIQLGEAALAGLRNKFRTYVKATVMEGTNTYRDVGIHLKGQYGTFKGIDGRPSLTLNFDKYIRGQRLFGMDKLHLNNSAQDPSYLCELIGRDLVRAAGIPTGRATHARVELNGRDLGLFVLIEGYDKEFLRRHFKGTDGNLYDSEFRHDITDPLRRSSGDGPKDHNDLKALAAAAQEPDPTQRLANLSKLIDLDRFYSMLAIESLARHHDGYGTGINNYWLYIDPASGKAVFIPHGMDQLFYEPQAALLPDLTGILARAVLQTQAGRQEFRSRCATLYTSLFPALPNRIERARTEIRPALAKLDPQLALLHDEAITNLQRRVRERMRYLERTTFLRPHPLAFDASGVASLSSWIPSVEGGKAILTENDSSGVCVLVTQLGADEKGLVARWQKSVLLPRGVYRFSARVSADQAVFRGPSSPVALKIWAMGEVQLETTRQDARTMQIHCVLETGPDQGEYLLECEARGIEMSVTYRFGSTRVARVQ